MIKILKSNDLFQDIDGIELPKLLKCLCSTAKKYDKNDIIFLADSEITSIGIVLSGDITITKEDFFGNRSVIDTLSSGDLFGEAIVCSGINTSHITVVARSNCEILFINFSKIITTCSCPCIYHKQLIQNMLKIIANKNILLNKKIEIMSAKTTRDKLMAYFDIQISRSGSNKFTISYDRETLADFLNVNRSSMSRELSKMRDEGIIKFNRNKFEVLN